MKKIKDKIDYVIGTLIFILLFSCEGSASLRIESHPSDEDRILVVDQLPELQDQGLHEEADWHLERIKQRAKEGYHKYDAVIFDSARSVKIAHLLAAEGLTVQLDTIHDKLYNMTVYW